MEKIRISNFFKKNEINKNITLRILNRNNYVLLSVAGIPIVHFGSSIMYNDFIKILEERPNVVLNALILLILTLLAR